MAFRGGNGVLVDARAHHMYLLRTLPIELLILNLYPRLYELHTMAPSVGVITRETETGVIQDVLLPVQVNLTAERLVRHGLFLLDCGTHLYLYVGSSVPPEVLMDLFQVSAYASLASGPCTLNVQSEFSERVFNIVEKVRQIPQRQFLFPTLIVVKEDSALKAQFYSLLIEDRHEFGPGYYQFLQELNDKVNKR